VLSAIFVERVYIRFLELVEASTIENSRENHESSLRRQQINRRCSVKGPRAYLYFNPMHLRRSLQGRRGRRGRRAIRRPRSRSESASTFFQSLGPTRWCCRIRLPPRGDAMDCEHWKTTDRLRRESATATNRRAAPAPPSRGSADGHSLQLRTDRIRVARLDTTGDSDVDRFKLTQSRIHGLLISRRRTAVIRVDRVRVAE